MWAWLWMGCIFITETDLSDRMDLDGDGVARPDDCDDTDPSVGTLSWFVDADGDGYGGTNTVIACEPASGQVADSTDCDDANANAYPGADERCNQADDDCDGELDEGEAIDAPSWYQDADEDGYGNPNAESISCEAPTGYVSSNEDCDDSDGSVHPGVRDTCDGADTDCNGEIDDLYWWIDEDGDGYGSDNFSALSCDQPSGYVDNDRDCDDGDPEISPAGTEVCDDENADEDCDGLRDDEDEVEGATLWYEDHDGDGFGDDATEIALCDPAVSWYLSVGGDCDDSDAAIHPDAVEIWYDGVDQDCAGDDDNDADGDGYASDAHGGTDCDDAISTANPAAEEACGDNIDNDCDGEQLGSCAINGEVNTSDAPYLLSVLGHSGPVDAGGSLASGGDVNGDGADDLLAGAKSHDSPRGGAYLVYGPISGDVDMGSDAVIITGVDTSGSSVYTETGNSVGFVDSDGDGYTDLMVAARDAPSGKIDDGGIVYLLSGPLSADTMVESAVATVSGADDSDLLGYRNAIVTIGDHNSDGNDEIAMGVYGASVDSSAAESGAVVIFLGPLSGTTTWREADVIIQGTEPSDYLGETIAEVGDTNGDGISDLVAGGNSVECAEFGRDGAFYLLQGPITSSGTADDAATTKWCSETSDESLGESVAGSGDVDGDGLADIVIGDPHQTSDHAGQAWVVHGTLSGVLGMSSAAAHIVGEVYMDQAGYLVAGAGDLNGDARGDVLVGAPTHDAGTSTNGVTYVLLGPLSGTISLSDADGEIISDDGNTASNGVGVGDIDGDSYPDIAVSTPRIVDTYNWSRILIFPGGPE